ncbi:MAG: sialate O-acetylesterase [Luteolibacter sp.]
MDDFKYTSGMVLRQLRRFSGRCKLLVMLFACLLLLQGIAGAQTTLPFVHPLFTSHMVIQRDAADPVWGWASPAATVTVLVKDQNSAALQTKTTTAGSDGRWQVSVGPFGLVTGNAAYSMMISSSGMTTTTLTDVLIGDVWLCTGQSNMEYNLGGSSSGTAMANRTNEIADAQANYPKIRHFKATRGTVAAVPQDIFIGGVTSGGWTTTADATNFSAIGYFMARDIYNKMQIPIGILNITWGGTDIIPWIPGETLRTIADYTVAVDGMPGNAAPGSGTATAIYNSMLAPAISFQIKGAIWYQGESSTGYGQMKYQRVLDSLRTGLRQKFGQPNLPFLAVQLATNGAAATVPVEAPNGANYAEIRQAQLGSVLADASNSRLVVTIDCGFVSNSTTYGADIHPINKQDPGKRAGQAALELVYGQTTQYLAPIFNHATVEGATMRCHFDHADNGLMVGLKPQSSYQTAPPPPVTEVLGGTLTGFAIAGANKVYYAATATIDTGTSPNTVIVSSPSVPTPLYVRYGWVTNPWNTTVPSASGSFGTPLCNLYGKITNSGGSVIDGTAASPFRSGGDALAQLSVNNGSGSGAAYTPGQTVSVVASGAPIGTVFSSWTGDTDLLVNPNATTTTATLSRSFVSIRANYSITAAPAALSALAENQKLTLTWNASNQAVRYNIKRSANSGGPYTVIGTAYSTSCVDSGLINNAHYYYVVSAVNSVSEGPNTAQLTATPVPTVSTLVAKPGSAQIVVTWNAYAGQVNYYNLKRATVNGGPYTTIATGLTTTSYADKSIANGVTYYYVVSVVDNVVENPNSLPASSAGYFMPPPLTANEIGVISPASQAGFGGGTFTVTAAGTDIWNGADVFHFIAAPVSGDATIIARITGPNSAGKAGLMFRQSLAANSAYSFININGGAKFENRATAGAGASNAGGTGTLTYPYWLKLVRTGNSFVASVAALASPNTWIQVGTTQTVVMADPIYVGLAFCGQNNISRTFTFDNITAPWTYQASAAPTGLGASAGTRQVTLNWSSTAEAVSYGVKRSAVSGGSYSTIAPNVSSPTFTNTGLGGSTYYYVVSAVNTNGESANSSEVSATPMLPPVTMAELASSSVTFDSGTANILLAISDSARVYRLQRSYTLSGAWENIGPAWAGGGPLNFSDSPDPAQGKTFYRIRIQP